MIVGERIGMYELRGEKIKEVYETIKKAEKPIHIKEIVASTNINYNTIRGVVQKLVKIGLIKRVGRGLYTL
jgi:predicted transcriptional regulator